ncbi:MAG TPA: ATP-binding protein [Opitutaceae bacterium]|nr:ATP-binding protein [Opitutaceae bacterium]
MPGLSPTPPPRATGRAAPRPRPLWAAYALAAVATLGTLGLRLGFAPWFGDRPVLVFFILPIFLSAYVGGLGPGLLATALAAVGTGYFLVPPYHSFSLGQSVDALQWLILVVIGGLISALTESLHARERALGESRIARERDAQERMAALRASEEKFSRLFDSCPAATSLSRLRDGCYLAVNSAFLRMFQRTREEVVGHTVFELSVWVDLAQRDALMAAFRAQGFVEHFEMRLRTKSGDPIDLLWSGVRVAIDGEDCLLGAALDISDRKRAEAKINQLNAELERRVTERTAQLSAANQELEAFSYSVSHDLRAPLRAVNGFSQLALKKYAGQLPEEGQRYLQTINNGAQQMGRLIEDLLAFSRLSRQALSRRPVDMAGLVRQCLDELAGDTAGRPIEIRVGHLPGCQGDSALLKQVWINLLSNAVKYSRGRNPAVIEVGCEPRDGRQVYFVRDNGAGFDPRYADKLFGVFQRLHPAEQFEGTGVGLAIAQRIVARHGGRIWADAAVDRGATFSFQLPLEGEMPSAK